MIFQKMFLSEEYDRNKPVLIVGKGPSARFVESNEDYYVACLNQSGRICEKIDFQFVGDQKPFEDMMSDYVDRVDNLIFPTKFNQQNTLGEKSMIHVDNVLPKNVQRYGYTFCGPTVWDCHDIENVMKVSVLCTGEVAFFWLLQQGFRNFKSIGIDINCKNNRRHKIFVNNGDCPDLLNNHLHDGWEELMFSRKQKLIKHYNANWEMIK